MLDFGVLLKKRADALLAELAAMIDAGLIAAVGKDSSFYSWEVFADR